MNSKKLFQDLPVEIPSDVSVSGISIDTRTMSEDELFVAIEGHDSDGHEFLAEAEEKGASAVLVNKDNAESLPTLSSTPIAKTDNTKQILPDLLSAYYGNPSQDLLLIGVTGTNGKTTTTHLLESIMEASGRATGLIGTIAHRFDDQEEKGETTTPSIVDNVRRLREWADRGAEAVVMEVSSHGLDQGRVRGLTFDAGVFTNLSQDHLDYHGTMEEYFQSKRELLLNSKIPVAFSDDEYGQRLIEEDGAVGVGEDGDYRVENPRVGLEGIEFSLVSPEGKQVELTSSLTGLFNYKNIALAVATARELGCSWDKIKTGISGCENIPGRCERLPGPPPVIVDYAHTPDAMDNVISSIKPLVDGRLICVFGAGGDRDRTKRPKMGRIASNKADYSIVTSDNPRSEPPMNIIDDILEGMNGDQNYHVEEDRGQAIRDGIEEASGQDLVLIVGRGHETEQIIGDQVIPFEDYSVAEEVLETID